MFNSSKVVGRLTQVTRHLRVNIFYHPFNNAGIISTSNSSRYSSKSNDKKPLGTTLKPEECNPKSNYSKPTKSLPPCATDGTCPPARYEECMKSNEQKPIWKQLLAALIIAGVTIYAISSTDWFTAEESSQDSVKKKKGDKGAVKDLRKKVKEPNVSNLIPQNVPYLLIGGGTASFSALRSIKSKDPKAKVLVITEEDLPYMRPPLSKELWYNHDNNSQAAQLNFKQWNGSQRSLFYEPREFYAKDISALVESDKGGVALATGWKVVKIDAVNKIVTLDDGYEIQYEKCLIATGAVPKTLPLFEQAPDEVKEKVLTFRTKEDFLELKHNINHPDVQNVVIIGGGFLGSELACSLARNFGEKKNIYQIFKEKYIMSQVLPEYLSEWTTSKTKEEGVRCVPSTEVQNYVYKNGKLSLILTGDQEIKADQVVVAVGVEANTELAEPSYLEVHPEIGGYLVNAELEARSNLWVAGDAACFYDVKLGRRRVEHHDHAVISGRLAGENMTGASKPYTHQSMFWSDLGPDIGYEAVGIIDSSLPTIGVFAQPSTNNEQDSVTNKTNEKEVNKVSISDVTIKKNNDNVHSDTTQQEVSKDKQDDFGKGVIFYLRDNTVIGIVLWNIFNRMSIARQVLAVGTKYEDLNEVAKLFSIHED